MQFGFMPNWIGEVIDRNPAVRNLSYVAQGVAPHAATVRATTTPATPAVLVLTTVSIKIQRVTVAAVLGLVHARITINGPQILNCILNDNTLLAEVNMQLTPQLFVGSAQVVNVVTEDLSTGGAIDYTMNVYGLEYLTAA